MIINFLFASDGIDVTTQCISYVTIVPFSCSTTEQLISADNHMFCDQQKEIIFLFRKFIPHVINSPDALLF
jgi:hypothetical protein